MRLDMKTAMGLAAVAALLLGGCEDTSKNTIRIRPAAPVPAQAQVVAENLPFPEHSDFSAYNLIDRRSRVDILISRMQANYTAGQRSYAGGDTDEARKLFNRAVGMVQESGIDVDSDIQLSELFDQIVDTMRSYDLDNTEADETDNTTEGMSEPAPIDEIADLTTLPSGDPRLAQKAISELMKVPHDMPLCVNDSVLQYLSFFQTEHGRADRRNRIAARGALQRNDPAGAEGRRHAAGFDLSGAGRIGVSAAGGFAGRRAGHLAIHAIPRAGIWARSQLVD